MSSPTPHDLSNRLFNLLLVLLIGLIGFFAFRMYEIWRSAGGNYPREISVEAQGSAFITPDTAEIMLGVKTEAETSELALEENTKKVNAIIKTLTDVGVDKKDIKTTNFNLSPKYNWTDKRGSFQEGFILEQTVQVRLKDFEKVGEIIAKTAAKGANMIGNVNFTIDNPDAAKEEARQEAIDRAKEKAQHISSVTGIKLGKVVNFYEYTPYGSEISTMARPEAMMDAGAAPEPPQIEPGQQKVVVNVTLTYRTR